MEDFLKIQNFEESKLEVYRQEVAKKLGIDLTEPKQEGRIAALRTLYEKYSNQVSICGYIYKDIFENCERLIGIYVEKQQKLDALKNIRETSFLLKTRLENVNYQYQESIRELEEKIEFDKQLLNAYENKYLNNENITLKHKTALKDLEDRCWDSWLKALDVNRELRNTIIGFENRKSLLKLSRAYIDYYIFVDLEIERCFEEFKRLKRDSIVEYYEILRRYQLPINKKIDFKVFLKKKLESRFMDATEIKSLFGDGMRGYVDQLMQSAREVKDQYGRDKSELISIINYYKTFLLQKQVFFTNEIETFVLYLKRRYAEKIDLLCSRFQFYNSEIGVTQRMLSEQDLDLLRKIFQEELDENLNALRQKYSQRLVPLMDNFWNAEQFIEKTYALDDLLLISKKYDLKRMQNINVSSLIRQFEEEKSKVDLLFRRKVDLITDVSKLNVEHFNQILKDLKGDCETICCELMNLNHRFWAKANAEFNCEARKLIIKLRGQYAPWIPSWKTGEESWMEEYLLTNLKHEVLKLTGEMLRDFSPESELYLKASRALFNYNEIARQIFKARDDIELEQLLKLNTTPTVNLENSLSMANAKIDELNKSYDAYWTNYNNLHSTIVNRSP